MSKGMVLARSETYILVWDEELQAKRWTRSKVSDTPSKHLLFRLVPSMPRTSGSASGLWPTPVANDDNKTPAAHMAMKARMKGGPRHKITSLQVMVKGIEQGFWPTPTRNGNHNRKGLSPTSGDGLATAVKMWPTPSSCNGTGGATGLAGGQGNRLKLYKMLGETEGKKMGCQSLNPAWVEWLQGYPPGWTEID